MGQGEFAQVKEQLTGAISKPSIGWSPIGDPEIYVSLADLAALQRDESGLKEYAQKAYDHAFHLGHNLFQAVSQRASGVLEWLSGHLDRAEMHLLESLHQFRILHTRYQEGRTLVDLAECAVAAGKINQAMEYYSQALSAFEALGAQALVGQVKERIPKSLHEPPGWTAAG